jgi:hypothetical protein
MFITQVAEKGEGRCAALLRESKESGEVIMRADRLHFSRL